MSVYNYLSGFYFLQPQSRQQNLESCNVSTYYEINFHYTLMFSSELLLCLMYVY